MDAIVALGDSAVPVLVANLHNDDKNMRLKCIAMLSMLDAEDAVPAMVDALRYDDDTDDWFLVAKLAEITDHPDGDKYYRFWFSPDIQQEATIAYRNWTPGD